MAAPGVTAAGALESDLTPDLLSFRDGFGAFASAKYYAANDWTTVRGMSGNWTDRYTPRDGRNLALAFARAEIGASYGSWRLSYQYRKDVIIDTNRDVLDLLYYQRNNLPIPIGRTFSVKLDAQALEAEGPRIAKNFELSWGEGAKVRAGVAAASLTGSTVRSTHIDGQATSTGPGTYSIEVPWLDSYSNKSYRFITPGSPSGKGYSLDAAIDVQWPGGNRAWLSVEDLYSRISWREIPSTVARATTSTTTRDAQGFIIYLPAVAGTNSRLEFTQRLDPKTSAGYSKSYGPFTAAAGVLFVRGFAIPSLNVDYRYGQHWRVGIARDFRFDTDSLSLSWDNLSLALTSDRRDLAQARALGIAFRYSYAF